ncbi:hypothetical protein KFL_009900010 [Klebsormidium nitens]|uniref:Root cap family protein n=1 Tax=Klebsormidium nitens TaxID=105231 RepID=A0A1Y1INN2_KLENI|nr:hypothetical protein KFL_009900010 [Klebsormidium nitens]|eukprot:GAQ92354.1 hypothetical protein KFL_009900010 [Klebsormidium nitens]
MAAIARFKAAQRSYRLQERLRNVKDMRVRALSLIFLLAASVFQGASAQPIGCVVDGECLAGSCCTAASTRDPGYCGTTCGTQCCAAELNMACSGDAATCGAGSIGGEDPHFELTGLPNGTEFTWDFHGIGNQTYCMVADSFLGMNVHMFSKPADVTILEQRAEVDNDFFEGTWMDEMGIMYFNEHSEKQSLEIVMNHSIARTSGDPLIIRYLGKDIATHLFKEDEVSWTSPDKSIMATRSSNFSVSISIPSLLTMEVEVEKETELITEPPIYYLNFKIKMIATTPKVHGFLGQMYAPGAVEKRLKMGTLDGFHHREYVEGPDEDYLTSNLTETDCSFNRFGTNLSDGETESEVVFGAFSSTSERSGIPGRRLLKATTARESRRLLEAMTRGSQCECVPLCNGSPCTDSCCNGVCTKTDGDDANNCGGCGVSCNANNALGTCVAGVCQFFGCQTTYADCNSNLQSDGCEVNLFTGEPIPGSDDIQGCGSCGRSCLQSEMNALPRCSGFQCDYVFCTIGYGDCDGFRANGCERRLDDVQNCGACNNRCSSQGGIPFCPGGGICAIQCNFGRGDCDRDDVNSQNGCETDLTTIQNCGGCGIQCLQRSFAPPPQCVNRNGNLVCL